MPRGVERTTWLGGGNTVVIGTPFCHLKIRSAMSVQRELAPGGPAGSGLRPGCRRFNCQLPLCSIYKRFLCQLPL
jgi:hypothetical protein